MPDTRETAAGDRTAIDAATVPPIRDPTTRRFLLIGFALWLVATVAFRHGGQFVLDPGPSVGVLTLYVVIGAATTGFALLLYRWWDLSDRARPQAAIALALPGMLLDPVVLVWFETAFPNVPSAAGPYLGGLLLWAYAAVLVSGFVPGRG